MKIEETKKIDNVSENELDDLFFAVMNGKQITEEIGTKRGVFKVKYPSQKELIDIDVKAAKLRNGIPHENFSMTSNFRIQAIAALDILVVDGPEWYKKAKQKTSFTWGDMPDQDLCNEIYVKAWAFREEVQNKFNGTNEPANIGPDENRPDIPQNVDDGLFADVATSD